MAAHNPVRRAASSRVSALSRSRSADDPALQAARRDLRFAGLEEHIQRVVDAAPALTPEQRDRLAVLLSGRVR